MIRLTVIGIMLITLLIAISEYAMAQDYPEGIVSYWKFDEGSGIVAYDSVGSNDGAISGASWMLGQVNGALDFGGSDYVAVPNAEALNPAYLTLEVWTSPTNTGYYRTMVEKQLPGFAYPWTQYSLHFAGNTSKPRLSVTINNIAYLVAADEPVPLNAWSHVAGTYDGETLKLYVNGVLVKTETSPSGPIDSSPDLLYIGHPPSNAYYYGKLDEVAVYNTALTADEIQQHYQNGLNGLGYEISEISVDIDIKPGSDPNSINLYSPGVVPVAILSSTDFDATTINPGTVFLAGAEVKMAGKSDELLCHEEHVNNDALMDMVCQVITEQFLIETGDSVAVLEAETYDGIKIHGEDYIKIVP